MKRTLAVVALLSGLGVLLKLSGKAPIDDARPPAGTVAATAPAAKGPDPESVIRARYPGETALVDRVLTNYHHNAVAIERSDGLRGLVLLDKLGLEAVFLHEKYPSEFRALREALDDDGAAAEVLLHWREYFVLKRSDEADRGVLIGEIADLTPSQRRAAARFPNALPLILAEPTGTVELIERWSGDESELRDALAMLSFIDLEPGAADLRGALRTLDDHGTLAVDAFRAQGPEGFALVKLYGPVLEALGDAMPLEDALIVLRVNSDDVDELLARSSPEAVAGHLRHVTAAGLVSTVGANPHALRLTVEFGPAGDRALRAAGADAADVVYGDYDDPRLRPRVVAALAEHGPMALAMLAKYAADADFREILRRDGAAVIPPIAQVDSAPEALAALRSKRDKSFTETLAQGVLAASGESGQATIRTIRRDGLERVRALNSSSVHFYQFLPLYDLIHLGGVVTHGQAPTTGELVWATFDGCFVVLDTLSLVALQPEGVAAVEATRSEMKAATRGAVKTVGREAAEEAAEIGAKAAAREGTEAVAGRLSRWYAVKLAGGPYAVLRRMPEALGKLTPAEISRAARPLCEKAGLRLSTWAPMRFLEKGRQVVRSIPPERGLKYVGVQAAQATVGVVGIKKMEEHLASRRGDRP